MYEKIIKYVSLALIVIGCVLTLWGYVTGFNQEGAEVDSLLIWAYIMVGVGIVAAIGGSLFAVIANDPKSLIKLGIGVVVCAVVIGVVYLTASGAPLVNHMGTPPSASTLKLADTMLNLTYVIGVAAIAAVLFGIGWGIYRNSK